MPAVDACHSPHLVGALTSTSTGGSRATHDMFDGMTQHDSICSYRSCSINFAYAMLNVLHISLVHFVHDECLIILELFMSDMINDNQGSAQMEYELGDPTVPSFEVGTTSNPNPSKKKKAKTTKARDPTFSTFEDNLLVKAWLATTMDPICGTEQKGNTYWEKIWKEYHKQKEYVEPHPIVTTHNVASLQHRWGIIQGEVNKYVGYYSQVTKRPQSGMGVATHVSSTASSSCHLHMLLVFAFSCSYICCWLDGGGGHFVSRGGEEAICF
jgi:hypothetical protein